MNQSEPPQTPSAATDLNEQALFNKRRALLKGSAAVVPAILTLRSGSALAAESTRCLNFAATQTNTAPSLTDNMDDDCYYRTRTMCRTLTPATGAQGDRIPFDVYHVPGLPTDIWLRETDSYPTATTFYVSDSLTQMKDNASPAPKKYDFVTKPDRWVLTHFLADGSISGYGPDEPGGGFAITTSCYGSF